MNRCYNFIGANKYGQYVACLPKNFSVNHGITSWEMGEILEKNNVFPCELVLKPFEDKYRNTPVVWHDCMYNEFAYFIASERLKNFLKARETENDSIEWIEVKIRDEETTKNYYILMLKNKPNVIDEKNTKYFLEDHSILVPCISLEKAQKYSVFTPDELFWKFPSLIYTTEKIKKELQNAKFSNLYFERTKTSFNGVVIKN